ncbi:MAG TPA: glycerophosphodiester phosphodiesterase family protein [Bacillota bacterium]|nr:glycerophosphodiester phosphodiesterase family protein [Bacillota bacterium]HOL09018.1 glycerophosphodiester phosphodiesterase family protein [Bacillota bacterium]HPO96693.1 glycerophosphodiester phosphodiesterase family protein [Bacillota bacterium]
MKRKILPVLLLFIGLVYLNNTSLLVKTSKRKPWLLAHRGVHQTFRMEELTNETCTAQRIYPPEHEFLENTIPSMEAAFAAGADVVEFDVHLTKDGQFAVFHDWTLDCRTDGQGVTREKTMAELKQLDVGYGYTADNGRTYPFRGKGIGLMPSLDEVLTRFPDRSLLIHIKSNDPVEGKVLAQVLGELSETRLERLAVYGGDRPIAELQKALPQLRVMSKATLKKALLSYMAFGWTGYVPATCRNTQVHIPEQIAPWLWGWPGRFLERMDRANTRVILVAGAGDFSRGFDETEDFKRIPAAYWGGIWTNRIERVGTLNKNKIK